MIKIVTIIINIKQQQTVMNLHNESTPTAIINMTQSTCSGSVHTSGSALKYGKHLSAAFASKRQTMARCVQGGAAGALTPAARS